MTEKQMALVKKLSMKIIVGNVKVLIREKEILDGQNIVRIYGVASAIQTGESDNGPWVAFKGQFKATNLLTGEVSASGKCFMPDVAGDLIEGAVANGGNVEFAFDIGIKFDDDSATGYVYTATPLMKAATDDAMNRLESNLPKLEKLEAPKSK